MDMVSPRPLAFQSTLPVRGATFRSGCWMSHRRISIHAPREGSDLFSLMSSFGWPISIHAPREGSDLL